MLPYLIEMIPLEWRENIEFTETATTHAMDIADFDVHDECLLFSITPFPPPGALRIIGSYHGEIFFDLQINTKGISYL